MWPNTMTRSEGRKDGETLGNNNQRRRIKVKRRKHEGSAFLSAEWSFWAMDKFIYIIA